jgi:1,4-dihydroxy-2-naphthoyl-CoA hydrolase
VPTTEAEYMAFWDELRRNEERWPPMNSLMGIEIVRLSPTTVASMQLSDAVRGPGKGTIHGGMLATFADTTMAIALWDSFDPAVEVSVTTDMHLRYYRQPRNGPLLAEASVVHKGRRLLSTECVVSDAEERVLSRSTATYMVVPRPG